MFMNKMQLTGSLSNACDEIYALLFDTSLLQNKTGSA